MPPPRSGEVSLSTNRCDLTDSLLGCCGTGNNKLTEGGSTQLLSLKASHKHKAKRVSVHIEPGSK